MKKRIIGYSFVFISNIQIVKIAIRFSTNYNDVMLMIPSVGMSVVAMVTGSVLITQKTKINV